MTLTDERNVDNEFTVFDIVNRQSSTVEKIVLQMGKETVHRRFVAAIPQSFKEKRAVKVIVELSRAEFLPRNMLVHWNTFRNSDLNMIRSFLKDIVPGDSII